MNKERRDKGIKIGVAAAIAALLAFFVAQNVGTVNWSSHEAAHVNDVVITEQDVLQEVTMFREAAGLADDEAWTGWLKMQNATSESHRLSTIDTMVHAEVVRQAAAQEGIEVSDDEVQDAIASNRELFVENARGNADETWQNGIRLNGYNDDTFAAMVRNELLEDKLAEKVGWGETYGTWINDFTASCDIAIAPMPEGLPY